MKKNRIYSDTVEVDKMSVKEFFNKRAPKKIDGDIKNSTMLQDKQPEIAVKRDFVEKETILPYIKTNNKTKILDIGCGIGRWAEEFKNKEISLYKGIDISEELIEVAKKIYKDVESIQFEAKDPIVFFKNNTEKFNSIILSGVLNYINDSELDRLFAEISKHTSDKAVIYLRMPISVINERLTLKEYWSDELQEAYSSIYRTDTEYKNCFRKKIPNFSIIFEDFLYKEDKLNNRLETKQKVYILEKKEN